MFERLKLGVLRLMFNAVVALKWAGKLPKGVAVQDHVIPVIDGRIKLRSYAPEAGQGPRPLMVFFHGGGWVGGNIGTHDALCRDLCLRSGYVIVSVDYRLAPEHPFPAAPKDCLTAMAWARDNAASLNADANRLVVAGDSAGGNLAAIVAIQARARHPGLVKGQVLIYPVTEHYSVGFPSYVEFGGKEQKLSLETMSMLWDTYLRGNAVLKAGEFTHELLNPLGAKDLRDLPPAFVVLAGSDLLKDEGLAYAKRMQESGVKVEHKTYPGQPHGFYGVEGPTPVYGEAAGDVAAWLKQLSGAGHV